MIYEIEKGRFSIINNILDETMDNIEIKSIIEGTNPGWIFVDSVDSPRTAMIWSKGIQGFYFVGDEDNSEFNDYINDFIDQEIKPRAIEEKLNRFEFSGESHKWDATLEKLFNNRGLDKSKQYIYKLRRDSWYPNNKRKLDNNYILKQIDWELINDPNIENMEFLTSEIKRWWSSYEAFFNKTFGYCILTQNMILNYCICNFVHEDIHTMGIETLKEFRRKGLSQATTEAFVENCVKNQLSPYWECMETNIPSRTLAEKLGFSRTYIYNLYSFSFK